MNDDIPMTAHVLRLQTGIVQGRAQEALHVLIHKQKRESGVVTIVSGYFEHIFLMFQFSMSLSGASFCAKHGCACTTPYS
jgi:hypothetical protein